MLAMVLRAYAGGSDRDAAEIHERLKSRPVRCWIARPGAGVKGPTAQHGRQERRERLPVYRGCRTPSRKASIAVRPYGGGFTQLSAPFRVPIRELTETWNSAAKCSLLWGLSTCGRYRK